jgi:hypothetical protein
MENDLADYIFNYCQHFFNEKEKKAKEHHIGQVKFGNRDNLPEPLEKLKQNFKTDDPEAIGLLQNGYSHFIKATAERIYRDHRSDLKLNLCPKCQKIARTPTARQCRFCGHDWHESE